MGIHAFWPTGVSTACLATLLACGGGNGSDSTTVVARSSITAQQMGMLDFRYIQTPSLTADEMNGTVDVTEKLNAAVETARKANKSLFIPSGTYLVSDTINCVLDHTGTNYVMQYPTNVIGSSIQHPVIKLADQTALFNGTNPKAVFHYKSSAGLDTGWVMQGGIRGIDIDLGQGNTKAVGLYWGCAQYCYIEDIEIKARDGFAGLTGIGGANNLLANIKVDGGQHALYLPAGSEATAWGMGSSPQNTITGCSFTNQTDIPVVLWGWGGITLVGTRIVKDSGVALKLMAYSDYIQTSPFSMIDSEIEFTSPNASNVAIQNANRASISLRGVYVKGAGTLCANQSDEDLACSGAVASWTHITRLNYVPKSNRQSHSSGDATSGYKSVHFDASLDQSYQSAVVTIEQSAPPADLTTKHIWASTPSFEDADTCLVTSADQLQEAINTHTKVALAKGTYSLSQPLELRSDTILFGCPGLGDDGTTLTYGFTPTQQTWLVRTVDDSEASTYLMDIATAAGSSDFLGSLNWRAGRNSTIRTIRLDKNWNMYEKNLTRLYFSDHGGGRVFNYQDEKNLYNATDAGNSSSFRKVKVSGTSQRLTFYGLNLERGGSYTGESSFPLLELTDAANVLVFGAKSETYQPYARINNCTNIFMTNIIDLTNINGGNTKQDYIEITGSSSDCIEIANAMFLFPPSASYLIVRDPWSANAPPRTEALGLYNRHWTTFF